MKSTWRVVCPRCGVSEQIGIWEDSAFFQAVQPARGLGEILLACAMCDHQFTVRLG